MLKAVILDDEERVCKLIETLVDWDTLKIELVGTAHDGVEGVKLIAQVKPDIIITDIRMPGYSGIEIIRETQKILPNAKFLIISGYRHFEYAHNALKYGVEHYLLKPIEEEDLNDALNKIAGKLQGVGENPRVVQQKKQEDITGFHSLLLKNGLLGGFGPEIEQLNLFNQMYHFHFKENAFRIIIVKLKSMNNRKIGFTQAQVGSMVKQVIEERMAQKKNWIFRRMGARSIGLCSQL